MPGQKLTFNITYYPPFQNVRSIMKEQHTLLTPNKEHKKVFPNVPVTKFRNGKGLKVLLGHSSITNFMRVKDVDDVGKKLVSPLIL